MRTDMLATMELFERALMRGAPREADESASVTPGSNLAPNPELAETAATLADLLRDQPDMLASLIDAWREAGDDRAADALAEIRDYLANRAMLPNEKRPPRLLDFFYPVV